MNHPRLHCQNAAGDRRPSNQRSAKQQPPDRQHQKCRDEDGENCQHGLDSQMFHVRLGTPAERQMPPTQEVTSNGLYRFPPSATGGSIPSRRGNTPQSAWLHFKTVLGDLQGRKAVGRLLSRQLPSESETRIPEIRIKSKTRMTKMSRSSQLRKSVCETQFGFRTSGLIRISGIRVSEFDYRQVVSGVEESSAPAAAQPQSCNRPLR